jgi:hypothetical protein
MSGTVPRVTLSYPIFLVMIAGLFFLGATSTLCGVLAIRFGLARGVRAVASTILLPAIAVGFAALLLWVNPVNGEYRAAPWFVIPGLLAPFFGARDVYKVFQRRREAREETERDARRPSYDLSRITLPPLE